MSHPLSRRHLVQLMAATPAVLAVAACADPGSGSTTSDGKTEITFSYLWAGDEAKALEKIISAYNSSQDKVTVKGISAPDDTKQLASMSSSKGTFDVSDNFGTNVGAWASKGVIASLDDYDFDTSGFLPVTLEAAKYDDTLYAAPIAVHSIVLVYNKDILEGAGVDVPSTIEEFGDAIIKLTTFDDSGAIDQLGIGYATADTLLTNIGVAFGGRWYDEDGKPTPTDAKIVEAMTWFQETVIDKIGADKLSKFMAGVGQYGSAEDPFYTGKYAMMFDGEWQSVAAKNTAPDLNWGAAPIPAASSEYENSTLVASSVMFIPANGSAHDAAADFIQYLVSEEPMKDFTLALGNLPALQSLLDSDAYSDLPNIGVWMDALNSDNASSLASTPVSSEYSTDLASAFDQIMRREKSAADALAAVEEKAGSYGS